MSMSHYALHPYPAYKPSGVEWLGDVPAHWDVRRLRNVLTGTNIRNQPDLPLLSVLRERGVILRDVSNSEENHNFIPDDLTNYKVVKNGQFAMNKMKAWQGSYGVSQSDGIVSPAYYVFDVQEVVQSYFHAATRSIAYVPFFAQASDGVRIAQWDLSQPRMREIPFLVPPAPEQRAIVGYLDYVDRRIRRYAAAKRKLIALLEEEKQAIVNQAVTCGLDPTVRFKPSGVGWLGDVPEHWEMRRSKRLFSPRQELARPNDIQLSATQAYGVIPQDEYERKVGRRIVKISLHLDKRRHVEVDDFVISMRSFQGGLERAWATGCIRSSYIILLPTAEVDVEFLSYVFKSRAYIKALQSTANFIRDGQDLNFNNFCAVDLPFPPAGEQRKIAVALGEATSSIDAAIARARRQIKLVQEYRTRLIADVVTGKPDVREAAAQLPGEADDQDPIEESDPLADGLPGDLYDIDESVEDSVVEQEVTA